MISNLVHFLESTYLEFGKYRLSLTGVVIFIAFILGVAILLQLAKRFIYHSNRRNPGRKYATYTLFRYLVLVIAFVIGLQLVGLSISVLIAGSAALLVGIGLGLQNLFSDYISGIIILIDSTVKVDDVIEVNGLVCKVQVINFRTTTVLSRNDKYLILPNSDLTRNQLINWTHNGIASRFELAVGVDYASDVKLVTKLLLEATTGEPGIIADPAPFVRFTDFGESSLNFKLFFWSEDVFRVENVISDMRTRILESFRANNIGIPFPQHDVHIAK